MKKTVLGFISLFVLGCVPTSGDVLDGGASAEPDKSSPRLKVVYKRWTSEDGARVTTPVNRFFDMKLGVECSFNVAEDGETRCLPVPLLFITGSTELRTTYFTDAACTQSLHNIDKCQPNPQYTYAAVTSPSGCGEFVPKMYKLGSPVSPAALYRKPFPGGPCSALMAPELSSVLASQNLYPVTPVAATDFVKGNAQSVIVP